MKWWGWMDLLGRLLLLLGLFLQLDLLAWFQTVELKSYLMAIVENHGDIANSLSQQNFNALYRELDTASEIEKTLSTAKAQQSFFSQMNLWLVGVGSVFAILARYFELRPATTSKNVSPTGKLQSIDSGDNPTPNEPSSLTNQA